MYRVIAIFVSAFLVLAIIIGALSNSDEDVYADEEHVTYIDEPSFGEEAKKINKPTIENKTESEHKTRQRLVLGEDSNTKKTSESENQTANTTEKLISDASVLLEIPRFVEPMNEQILKKTGYTLSYNNQTKCANWVAWHLTKEHSDGEWSRKGIPYMEDFDAMEPRQETQDWKYNPKGYDHGHMCPAGDNKWSKEAMEDSFYLTNMCPQNRSLNGGDWKDLEEKCREWAYHYGSVYITCGPIFSNGMNETMGGNKEIWVPDSFYKVVLCMTNTPKCIGFIYPNSGKHHQMSFYACSVDQVEQATGIDFFYSLPDEIEEKIESSFNFLDWR